MKTSFLIAFIVTLMLPLQILSEIDNKYELNSDRILQKTINPIVKPDEQIKQRLQSENFRDSLSRTIINKKRLDNGFLLIEEILQLWYDPGSNWVDFGKYTYTYDVNNNLIEWLRQEWNGYNWVNDWKRTYTYDVNNNMIEGLEQKWDGSIWVNEVNDWKRTYTYDVNNKMIEQLYQKWDGSIWVNDWN